MNATQLAEFRHQLTGLVRAAGLPESQPHAVPEVIPFGGPDLPPGEVFGAGVRLPHDPAAGAPLELPLLATAQQLALSVLLREPQASVEHALADYLIDQGHDYATSLRDRTKETTEVAERLRVVFILNERFDRLCWERLEALRRGDEVAVQRLTHTIETIWDLATQVTGGETGFFDPTRGEMELIEEERRAS